MIQTAILSQMASCSTNIVVAHQTTVCQIQGSNPTENGYVLIVKATVIYSSTEYRLQIFTAGTRSTQPSTLGVKVK